MAAGLGFKTFATGDVLSAGDVNGYLMQGVLVFASAAARDSAITSPQEGQFAYLKDTNVTTYYTGSAWANLDTTGMTNPMTTTGDTIYSSSGSTPARLGIGSTGEVLTVAGGVPTWAAAGGSPIKQIVTASLATLTSTTSSSYVDTGLTATITPSSSGSKILVIYASAKMTVNGSATSMTSINAYTKLLRGATAVSESLHGFDLFAASNYKTPYIPFTITCIDSPSSTSALTYKVQYQGSATQEVVFANSTAPATIILMEI